MTLHGGAFRREDIHAVMELASNDRSGTATAV
jgi:hypothetical protein